MPYGIIDDLINDSVVNPAGDNVKTLGAVFGVITNIMMGIGTALAMVFLTYSGIQFITSAGDPKALANARRAFFYSLIAFFLAAASMTIKWAILNLLGVTDTNLMGFPSF